MVLDWNKRRNLTTWEAPFPMAAGLFGAVERMRFIFRSPLRGVEALVCGVREH